MNEQVISNMVGDEDGKSIDRLYGAPASGGAMKLNFNKDFTQHKGKSQKIL